ncbi:hypothetical protein H0H87_001789 [Tephrocybe sp. NHM501043]|nr:hypothetical protein H0H87_001789 [Tephrocybe sp. NHM501043]
MSPNWDALHISSMVNTLFSNNPLVSHTLREFVNCTNELSLIDSEQFINFTLTGKYTKPANPILDSDDDDDDDKIHVASAPSGRQAFMDLVQDVVHDDEPLNICRDYDSLLGVTKDFMMTFPISIYLVPHLSFVVKKSLHIKYTIVHDTIEVDVEFHKIPNFEFSTFGLRSQINIFFPKLWSPERAKSRQAYWLTDNEPEWPAMLEAEMFRARRSRGGFLWGTKMLPADRLPYLAQAIHNAVRADGDLSRDNHHWLQYFFILHTVHGVKQTTYHNVSEPSAKYYLKDFLEKSDLPLDILRPEGGFGHWYINVAIEIMSAVGSCLQWRTANHHEVVRQALDVSAHRTAIMTLLGLLQYSRDYASHLTALSGFCIKPGITSQGTFEAAYIQAYTTDKSILYNNDLGHHAKFLEGSVAGEDKDKEDQGEEEEEGEEEEGRVVAHNPYGYIFFGRLMLVNVPHFCFGGPILPPSAINFWFSMNIEELVLKYVSTGMIDHTLLSKRRMTTNKVRIPLYVAWGDSSQPALFDLGPIGATPLPPSPINDGSDIEDMAESPPLELLVNKFVSELWQQFIVDIVSKSPNPKGIQNTSYVRLNAEER